MSNNTKGWILVSVQFFCLGMLFGLPLSTPFSAIGLGIFGAGIVLGIWALIAMPPASLSVHPQPKPTGRFISRGPYRLIRHPMYSAVILVAVSQVFDYPTQKNYMAILALIITLVVKIMLEEKLLINQYEAYAQYKKSTKKLIPFIW